MTNKNRATREGFGEALLDMAPDHPELLVATADLGESLHLTTFQKQFPHQFVEVGVAEQNLIGVCSGVAMNGRTAVATSFATFNPGRNWEQIRTAVCLQNLNVKIVGSHAGLATGADGATHQALEDIALARVLPNMTVVVPADYLEAQKATHALIGEHLGPAYLRLSRATRAQVTQPDERFLIGKANLMTDGVDATIVACGLMVEIALQTAAKLHEQGLDIRVLNMHTIKPLDHKALLAAASETGALVTIEEHQIYGGLGSAVAEFLSTHQPVPLEIIGVPDAFGESGTPDELFLKHGLTVENLMTAVLRVIDRK